MKEARPLIAIVLLIIGIPFTALLFDTVDTGFTLKIFTAGPALILMGLSLLTIAKGPNLTIDELKGNSGNFITQASLKDKIVWGICIVFGILISNSIFPTF